MSGSSLERRQSLVRRWAARPKKAVIFDFNGTLSNDEPILEAIFTEIFADALGWAMTSEDYRSHLLGHSDREIVEIAVREHGGGGPDVVEELLAQRRVRYLEMVADASPITPAAIELVRLLAEAEIPMAIVTGAQREDVLAVLSGSPVGAHLEILVTEEDVRRGKPDPEGFLRGASLLAVEPADVLVFEDSAPGMEGARRAGMSCIAVNERDALDVGIFAGIDL